MEFNGLRQIKRANILGVGVSAVNMETALQTVDEWIDRRDPHYVCVTGVHGVIESQRDESIRRIHNDAGLVTPDGMPLVWLSRLQGFSSVERVYGPDLMLALCQRSVAKSYRNFLYGGAEGVPELLAERLRKRFPGLQIVGVYSPPFRPLNREEDLDLAGRIKAADADILWVGLSTPKQEIWMATNLDRLCVPVMIGVGAAFDFHAGLKKQAPTWMQRNGLEWLFRLLSEPGRLWQRYLINNPQFVFLVLLQFLGIKRYTLEY